MKAFYKLNPLQVGQGTLIHDGFTEYIIGQEPLELQEALEIERLEQEAIGKAIEAKKQRELAMLEGAIYTLNNIDYKISFTKNDGDGLVQVKSAFELGLSNTIIVFENGTKLPISASEFISFASWFVSKRNEFFI